jgi:hypothetical protein
MDAVDSTALSDGFDPEFNGGADVSAEDAIGDNTEVEIAAVRLGLGQAQKLIFIQRNDPLTRVEREHDELVVKVGSMCKLRGNGAQLCTQIASICCKRLLDAPVIVTHCIRHIWHHKAHGQIGI